MKYLFFLYIAFPFLASAQEQIVVECKGRNYWHRVFLIADGNAQPTSYRYERNQFFGNTLQESFGVLYEEFEPTDRRFTFSSIDHGALFNATSSRQRKQLNGVWGEAGTGSLFRKSGSGGPNDYIQNCWINADLLSKLPARLP